MSKGAVIRYVELSWDNWKPEHYEMKYDKLSMVVSPIEFKKGDKRWVWSLLQGKRLIHSCMHNQIFPVSKESAMRAAQQFLGGYIGRSILTRGETKEK